MGIFSATTADADELQRKYAETFAADERVIAAFRTIRDTVFLTDRRFVLVDVQGVTGKKVEFVSIPYRAITRFSLETAGTFDLDAELRIWVSSDPTPIAVKVSRGADIALVQRTLVEHVCR